MLKRDIQFLKGVGPQRAKLFKKLGVETVEDLLFFIPRDLQRITNANSLTNLQDKEKVSLEGQIVETPFLKKVRNNLSFINTTISTGNGRVKIVIFNRPYLLNKLKVNSFVAIEGVYNNQYKQITVSDLKFPSSKSVAINEKTPESKYVPVYNSTEELSQKIIRQTIFAALTTIKNIDDSLPEEFRLRFGLHSLSESIRGIHLPVSEQHWHKCKNRFIFEELTVFQTAMLYSKQLAHNEIGIQQYIDNRTVEGFINNLKFSLTDDQKKVIGDILRDMGSQRSMNRLVQGDVGSGKTIVATVALLVAALSGGQGVLLAPTEILAEQHYKNLYPIFKEHKIEVVILTSSTKDKEKIYMKIQGGESQVVIGTHAVLQQNVEYKNLSLIVTDEQHRFGVKQRAALRAKGKHPDVLVMSATPIPRTLSQVLYGDLDVSMIKQMPMGRKPILTYSVSPQSREKVYEFIIKELKQGKQGYIICPLIEESEKVTGESAITYHSNVSKIFDKYKVGLLHGQMKQEEKDQAMLKFKEGYFNMLVSTTVVEVGVDVPNATVIVIENAEKFGLAQLHQLRGRVGRSSLQSYCILICHSNSETAKKRMGIMTSTTDGFRISEEDLKLRGPGEFFGIRQHGLPEFKYFNLLNDLSQVSKGKEAAEFLISKLQDERYAHIFSKISDFYHNYLN
ncbi:ATP-dependent DNA helicase RecG [Alkalicella caledoniensis]|uniref:ATP-dependent DNA helicase RecG n=1 Tax=Alkalicella caledoniensis TaxID=2731377 RepID=A0A7G9WCF1_ALKCA|nr:ATP-dependent DNA helicase RecG [Alkalicella caledoniensis]QNO16363.1 ATP-dependent DNA helicase RecG [Alkalicella caledoniensis]